MTAWRNHYLETLRNVPPAIENLFDLNAGVGENYTNIRREVYADAEDGLPLRYKELLFVVMDIELGNGQGAENHLRAGIEAGLTRQELADALMQLIMVRGISAWGLTGHDIWNRSENWFVEGNHVQH